LGAGIGHGLVDPGIEFVLIGEEGGRDDDHAAHGATGEVHLGGAPGLRVVVTVGPDPDHQVVPDYPACHSGVDHERQPTEHLFLLTVGAFGDGGPDPVGKLTVEDHTGILADPGGRHHPNASQLR